MHVSKKKMRNLVPLIADTSDHRVFNVVNYTVHDSSTTDMCYLRHKKNENLT